MSCRGEAILSWEILKDLLVSFHYFLGDIALETFVLLIGDCRGIFMRSGEIAFELRESSFLSTEFDGGLALF